MRSKRPYAMDGGLKTDSVQRKEKMLKKKDIDRKMGLTTWKKWLHGILDDGKSGAAKRGF